MKHIYGNTPACWSCFFYREKERSEDNQYTGWCVCKVRLKTGINGRKREHPPEREAIHENHGCRFWEDAETRVNHFEIMTGLPDPSKSQIEQESVRKILEEEREKRNARLRANG